MEEEEGKRMKQGGGGGWEVGRSQLYKVHTDICPLPLKPDAGVTIRFVQQKVLMSF